MVISSNHPSLSCFWEADDSFKISLGYDQDYVSFIL